jgi:hypothetical protein
MLSGGQMIAFPLLLVIIWLGDGRNFRVTVVAQWAKAPGIHCYVAYSIPAVTPRYYTKKKKQCSLEHKKNKGKKNYLVG